MKRTDKQARNGVDTCRTVIKPEASLGLPSDSTTTWGINPLVRKRSRSFSVLNKQHACFITGSLTCDLEEIQRFGCVVLTQIQIMRNFFQDKKVLD